VEFLEVPQPLLEKNRPCCSKIFEIKNRLLNFDYQCCKTYRAEQNTIYYIENGVGLEKFLYFCSLLLEQLKFKYDMILRTENVIKKYKKRTVVEGVSVEVKQGEIVGLLGPNGAGKTTTFYMIVGIIKPFDGRVFLDDRDITDMPMYERAKNGIGYLAQEASVFRHLSVEDNIMSILEFTKLTKAERKAKLESLLDEFGLQHIRKSLGIQLSGGERRRTEIARALAMDPKFLLLDEPFAGVDPIAVQDIQAIVSKLKDKNIGILITDHNVHETLSITDRAYLLFEGSVLKSGTPEDLANDEHVRKVYLGDKFELR
jgi:lipopolysaccharide export system ATP-binding protein